MNELANRTSFNAAEKTHYAWIADHTTNLTAHKFPHYGNEARCEWCGRTRLNVRFDELPPQCAKRPASLTPVTVANDPKNWQLLNRAFRALPRILSTRRLTPQMLVVIHRTMGFHPDIVAVVKPLPPGCRDEYSRLMSLPGWNREPRTLKP